jgi:hypothetical protein
MMRAASCREKAAGLAPFNNASSIGRSNRSPRPLLPGDAARSCGINRCDAEQRRVFLVTAMNLDLYVSRKMIRSCIHARKADILGFA